MSLSCYHCNEKVLTGSQYQVEILGTMQTMCCLGCESVANLIIQNGLDSYYQYRTEPAAKIELVPEELKALFVYDSDEIQRDFVHEEDQYKTVTLSLDGVSCAACAWLIEKRLIKEAGVIQVSVNTTTHRALVIWDKKQTKLSTLLNTIHLLGYKAVPFEPSQQDKIYQKNKQQYLYKLGVAGLATMQVMMLAVALYMDLFQGMEEEYRHLFRWVSLIFSTPVLFYSASPFYINAWRNVKAGSLGMDVPVTAALLFAYFASCYATLTQQGEVYFESISMFTFFLLLGRFLELRAKQSAAAANTHLLSLLPKIANLVNGKKVHAKSLTLGMTVRVLPGEAIPADGKIIDGETSVNEAMLTGESLPVSKKKNDDIYAGTVNIEGNIVFEVSKEYKDSLLAKIVRLQDSALLAKSRIVLVADNIAKFFVAAILLIAFFTWLYWQQQGSEDAFWIMLSVLVATCPCALSLATPAAITCAASSFSRLGLLVRNSHVYETLTKINHVILDKTGTLTQGNIKIDQVIFFDPSYQEAAMAIATALEGYSSHPIAKAFRYTEHETQKTYPFKEIKNKIGKGVSGKLLGQDWRIGSKTFALYAEKKAKSSEYDCHIWLSCDGKKIAGFYLQDNLRASSRAFILALKKQKMKVTMLTGDSIENAKEIAHQLNITKLVARASPEGKLKYINNLPSSDISMMVGDGVNDAPILSRAHLSVAMGSGTDIAKSSADLVLLGDDLSKLLLAQKLAQFTNKIIKQNLFLSLSYNAVILPLAVAGMLAPYIAVIGMSASSVIVVTNSLRIINYQQK